MQKTEPYTYNKTAEKYNMKEYQFPPISLLSDSPDTGKYQNPQTVLQMKEKLQALFDSFNLKVKVVDSRSLTIAILFRLQLGSGVTAKTVRSCKGDIEAVMEDSIEFKDDETNEKIVYITIRDMNRPRIALKELIHSSEFINCKSKLPVAAGMDFSGGKLILDLEKIQNLLVVGVTGSGKSVFLSDLITSILFRSRPDEVQFIFFDFKGVELPLFDNIPHLIIPSVKARDKAMKEMERLADIANRRQLLLAMHNKTTFEEYNKTAEDPLPRIVVIIDEYMSLMENRRRVESKFSDIVKQLTSATPQTGIHLVLSTQRPSSEVITAEISEAIPHRVSFFVRSGTDSRIAISRTGAQRLLGEGDMIYADLKNETGTHAQAALITDEEIDRIIQFCNGQIDFGAEEQG